ncbi:Peptidyl-prolyl cis-trans isomerase A precursor [compost metagenome]
MVALGYYKKATFKSQNPVATIEVEGFGTIKVELYPDMAPESVTNFIALANNNFYNGLKFHRIVEGFMIQGGDKNGGDSKGTKKVSLSDIGLAQKDANNDKPYSIKGEFITNGVENTLKMDEGVIAMARADYTSYSAALKTESYNSADSQFFIVTKKTASLDGNYAGFGKVIEGLDIVHKIEKVEVKVAEETDTTNTEENANAEKSTPVNDVIIKSVTVETFGIDYGKPDTLTPFDYTSWLYSQYGYSQ